MRIKQSLFLILLLFSFNIMFSQEDIRIEKKLNKLFVKNKYQRCYDKAFKYNKKYRKSEVPELYISKVELKWYLNPDFSETKKYKHLKNAVKYSYNLSEKHNIWKNEVKDYFIQYIELKHDSTKINRQCKSAISYYTRKYKDTLGLYSYYFKVKKIKKEEKSPIVILSKTDSLRAELLKFAAKQKGIKYYYTGVKPETGFDCSGFTLYAYKHIGVELPHNAHLQSKMEGENKTLENAIPGDLVFFGSRNKKGYRTQHAGIIYSIEDGQVKVVHCVSNGVGIDGKNSSWEHYWKDKVLFVKTLPIFQ